MSVENRRILDIHNLISYTRRTKQKGETMLPNVNLAFAVVIVAVLAATIMYARRTVIESGKYFDGNICKAINLRRTEHSAHWSKLTLDIEGPIGSFWGVRSYHVPRNERHFKLKWVDREYGPMCWVLVGSDGIEY